MAALVDTNVLVYRFDPRFPVKQTAARELLRRGVAQGSLRLPNQAVVEFVAVVSRPLAGGEPLLPSADARRAAEELLSQFEVLYPTERVVRTALRGAAAYSLAEHPRSRTSLGADRVPFSCTLPTTIPGPGLRMNGRVRLIHPAAARGRAAPTTTQNFRAVMIWLNVYSPSRSPGQSTFTWVRAEIVLLAKRPV